MRQRPGNQSLAPKSGIPSALPLSLQTVLAITEPLAKTPYKQRGESQRPKPPRSYSRNSQAGVGLTDTGVARRTAAIPLAGATNG